MLEGKKSIVILGHMKSWDGDCIGSLVRDYSIPEKNLVGLRSRCIWRNGRKFSCLSGYKDVYTQKPTTYKNI